MLANSDLFLLDVLVDDLEALDDILRRLNGEASNAWWRTRGKRFERQEVVAGLTRLIKRHWVRTYVPEKVGARLVELPDGVMPAGDYSEAWFGITGAGKIIHAAWEQEASDSGG